MYAILVLKSSSSLAQYIAFMIKTSPTPLSCTGQCVGCNYIV